MNNTDFETSKLQAIEKITVRYDKYATRLKKMLSKARKLERYLQRDYRGYVAIECGDANQSFTPIQTAQFIARDISNLIPLVERARDRAQCAIMETEDQDDFVVVEAYEYRQLGDYAWDVRNLKKPLQAFKDGYGSGVEAYIMSRQAWREHYL